MTGAGTFALLAYFPEAHVTAVDSAIEHLHRLQQMACETEVADHVRTVQADLDDVWPDLGEPDLVWASASLHHMADPRPHAAPGSRHARPRRAVRPRRGRRLPPVPARRRPAGPARPRGAVARGQRPRHHAAHTPRRGVAWGPRLTAAGFTLDGQRTITFHIEHSRSEAVGRYALSGLRRMRDAVADALPADDPTALDRLLHTDGPHGVLRRDDLAARTERTVWAARRA